MESFAGLTAKAWVLMDGTNNPLLLALHFALLTLPTLVVSGPAGVVTDREGCEPVLIRAQWGLFAGALVGAAAIPLLLCGDSVTGAGWVSGLVANSGSARGLFRRSSPSPTNRWRLSGHL